MRALTQVVQRAVCLADGRLLFDGTPGGMLRDQQVRAPTWAGRWHDRAQRVQRSGRRATGTSRRCSGSSLDLAGGETVALVGANGAGKTTLLMTIAGALRPWRGRITLDGADITGPARLPAGPGRAWRWCPEGRRLFPSLTAEENILVPAAAAAAGPVDRWTRCTSCSRWSPARRTHRAALLSGGEQQAVAIARALAANPRVLLLDEVSLGLAPAIVDALLRDCCPRIQASGVSILLVEQDIDRALAASARTVCLLEGRVVLAGDQRLAGPGRRSSPPTSARRPRRPAGDTGKVRA